MNNVNAQNKNNKILQTTNKLINIKNIKTSDIFRIFIKFIFFLAKIEKT